MAKLKIKIKKNGQTEIKVEGASGPGCKSLTKALEKALGVTTKDTNTSDFYKESTTTNTQTISNG